MGEGLWAWLGDRCALVHQHTTTQHPLAQRYAERHMRARPAGMAISYVTGERPVGRPHEPGPMHALVLAPERVRAALGDPRALAALVPGELARLRGRGAHWACALECLAASRLASPRALRANQGAAGLARTREVVRSLGLTPVGGPAPADATAGVRAGGLRAGVAALTYGINGLRGPPPGGVPVERFGDPGRAPD